MSQATEKSRRTKAHIIQSAVEMITEHGLEKISVNKVIRHAGISKGGFYYYFSDIDHLIKEVFLFCFRRSLEGFQPEDGLQAEEYVKRLGRHLLQSVKRNPREHHMMFLFISKCFADERYRREFVKLKKPMLEDQDVSKRFLRDYGDRKAEKMLPLIDMVSIGYLVHAMMEDSEAELLKMWDILADCLVSGA